MWVTIGPKLFRVAYFQTQILPPARPPLLRSPLPRFPLLSRSSAANSWRPTAGRWSLHISARARNTALVTYNADTSLSASQKQLNLKHVNSLTHSNSNTKSNECFQSQHLDAFIFICWLNINICWYKYSHQWSFQVEGLSILEKQHDVSFQITQATVTMAPNPLLQQT